MHLGTPISVRLPGLKGIELILEANAWIVLDRSRGEVPVLAWVDFRPSSQRGLHEPVDCTLHYYHYMASGIRAKVLERMADVLETALRKQR